MTLEVGQEAPTFTLRDQHGAPVAVETFRRERAVLVVFYPFAFSGVCTGEMAELRDRAGELEAAGAQVLGVSCDPMFALRVYADQERIGFPLLSDFWPHGEVAAAYDVLDRDRGCPQRSTFLLDRAGRVRWQLHNPMGEARDVGEYLHQIAELA